MGDKLTGVRFDAEQWEAFADELEGRSISIPADIACARVAGAARRVAARIRLKPLDEPADDAGRKERG